MTRASFSPRRQTPAYAQRVLSSMRHTLHIIGRRHGKSARREALKQWLAMCYGGKPTVCINCGKLGSHFAPPCFGEEGFFTCTPVIVNPNEPTRDAIQGTKGELILMDDMANFDRDAVLNAMKDMPEQAGECHGYVEPIVWDAIEAQGEKWPPNFHRQELIGGRDGRK